jgi:hypothetical protein
MLALEVMESGPDVDPIFAGETITALKAALEQPEQRKPLTDEEIQQVVLTAHGNQDWTLVFARAIEAAHDIKEGT